LSYDIPWESVDPDQASQSLSVSNFTLNIAGQNLTEASASFTTLPTAEFAYGEFKGLTFAIDTSGISGFPYTSMSMSDLDLTVQPQVGDPINVTLAPKRTVLVVDFSGAVNHPDTDRTHCVYH